MALRYKETAERGAGARLLTAVSFIHMYRADLLRGTAQRYTAVPGTLVQFFLLIKIRYEYSSFVVHNIIPGRATCAILV